MYYKYSKKGGIYRVSKEQIVDETQLALACWKTAAAGMAKAIHFCLLPNLWLVDELAITVVMTDSARYIWSSSQRRWLLRDSSTADTSHHTMYIRIMWPCDHGKLPTIAERQHLAVHLCGLFQKNFKRSPVFRPKSAKTNPLNV